MTLHLSDYSLKLNTTKPDVVIVQQGKVHIGMVLISAAIVGEPSAGRVAVLGSCNAPIQAKSFEHPRRQDKMPLYVDNI